MVISTLISILCLVPLAIQLQVEAERRVVMQLDRTDVTFCRFEDCGILDDFQQIEPLAPAVVTEGEFGTEVLIEVINHGRLEGQREVWALLRTTEGKIVEGMKIWLDLDGNGRSQIKFFFTGTKAEFEAGVLELGF